MNVQSLDSRWRYKLLHCMGSMCIILQMFILSNLHWSCAEHSMHSSQTIIGTWLCSPDYSMQASKQRKCCQILHEVRFWGRFASSSSANKHIRGIMKKPKEFQLNYSVSSQTSLNWDWALTNFFEANLEFLAYPRSLRDFKRFPHLCHCWKH